MRGLAAMSGVVLATAALTAQSPALPHLVLTALPGPSPIAQLVEVQSGGAVQTLGRFPSDNLAPLALAVDRYDGAILVGLDQGSGQSRIVRLQRGSAGFGETPIAVVSGRIAALGIQQDELLIGVDAANGGIFRTDRRHGGTPIQVLTQPNLTAMQGEPFPGPYVAVAWTGRPGSAAVDSGTALFDYATSAFLFGPHTFPNPTGAETTGIVDLPTAIPRQLLSFDDGTYALFAGLIGNFLLPVPTTPAVPSGGAAAMHSAGLYSVAALTVGGAAYPFVYEIDGWSGAVTLRSAALPGDPIDLAPGLPTSLSLGFGSPCGATALLHSWGGLPRLGTTLHLNVSGPANAAAFFVAGFDDFLGGVLPAPLPGGCTLQVAPDAVRLHLLSASGNASAALSLPNFGWLFGVPLYGQWVHVGANGMSTSNASVHWIGL